MPKYTYYYRFCNQNTGSPVIINIQDPSPLHAPSALHADVLPVAAVPTRAAVRCAAAVRAAAVVLRPRRRRRRVPAGGTPGLLRRPKVDNG